MPDLVKQCFLSSETFLLEEKLFFIPAGEKSFKPKTTVILFYANSDRVFETFQELFNVFVTNLSCYIQFRDARRNSAVHCVLHVEVRMNIKVTRKV